MNGLLTTYNRKSGQNICNCTMCPQLGNSRYSNEEYSRWNYCDIIEGRIDEPGWCWCNTGIALMWMVSHKPEEVIGLLALVD